MSSNKNKNNKKSSTPKKNKKSGIDNLSFFSKVQILFICVIIFGILFLIMYRNSKINEAYSEINGIKNKISKIEKENSQLEVSIQSSLNLKNIEESAKTLLGMQKLTNAQTIYINLPKKDYIESAYEDDILDERGFFQRIVDGIKNIF